jgi:hypothetical protein
VPLLNAANNFTAAQTITGTASIHQTLTGGAAQNGLEYDAIGGHAQMYTASAGSGTGIGSGSGWMVYDITNTRWPFYYDDVADTVTITMPLTVTGATTAGAGSTDYSTASSAYVAHCLADGTGGGVCGGGVTPITGTVTLTPVTNTTSVSCASTTCTNVRGVLTIVQSGTNGEVNVSWPTTTTAQICSVASNDGSQLNGYYTDVATAIGVNIFFYTAGIGTIHPMYSCQK